MSTLRKVLIAGSAGQLGWELQRSRPDTVELVAHDSNTLDITQRDTVMSCVQAFRPDVIINAAAYTAVDRAEQDVEVAYLVNREGAAHLAEAAVAGGARLIHVSTDFVFDGQQSTPYKPADTTHPVGVYGASKLAGEQRVLDIAQANATIIRTSWVYSVHGHNFVKTMLRLMGERDQLGVVCDQIGTPTWANGLARTLWQIAARGDIAGVHHWTDLGVASWYDFAVAIQQEALVLGLLEREIPIRPIATSDYPTPARRPSYSVLDKHSLQQLAIGEGMHWRTALSAMLAELKGLSENHDTRMI